MPGPNIDGALVRHVAELASLSLSDDEAARFTGELAKIVAYVAQLDALDTRDVPPTAHVQIERMPLRADELRPCLTPEEALAQAPRVEGAGFAVPAFVDEK
jgi:aspartyl-tRNA(Asn)/glutamyl-tRNA(Gln) amidotransferase subunit C